MDPLYQRAGERVSVGGRTGSGSGSERAHGPDRWLRVGYDLAVRSARVIGGRAAFAIALASLVVATAGCGSGARRSAAAPVQPDGEHDYPALRWVPADVSYALVAARTADLATGLRELLRAAALLGAPDIEAALARSLGADPLSPDDLAAAGIALDGSAALFSDGIYPTLLLPIEAPDALAEFLDARQPGHDVSVRRHHGYDLFSYRFDEQAALRWLVMDRWLLVHVSGPGDRELGWLDPILAVRAGQGLAASAAFRNARARAIDRLPRPPADDAVAGWFADQAAPVHPGLVGLIRVARLRIALGAAMAAVGDEVPAGVSACLDGSAADAIGFVGAEITWNGADGVFGLPLEPGAAARLSRVAAPAPPPGYRRFRDQAAISADLALNLGWLRRMRDHSGCYLVLPMRATDRLIELLGGPAVLGYHLAGSDFGPLLGLETAGRAAVHLAHSDPGFARSMLDRIPSRSLFERARRIGTTEVRAISVPTLPRLVYRLDPTGFTASLGDGVAEEVFDDAVAPGSVPDAARGEAETELVGFAIRPGRLAAMPEVIRAAASVMFDMSSRLDMALFGLRQYELGQVRLGLHGRDLVLSGAMRRRRR